LGLLEDYILLIHDVAPFDCSEVRLDAAQAGLLLADALLELGSAKTQHPGELLERRLTVEQSADLLKREAQVTQRQQPVKAGELVHAVRAVTRIRVDAFRPEQPQLVVVAEHPRRDLPEPGELSDVQHDDRSDTASHGVKVKASP
jgi:hypothetical protein